MMIEISFSLATSTGDAWGTVTGSLELADNPQVGDRIDCRSRLANAVKIGFPPALIVEAVPKISFEGQLLTQVVCEMAVPARGSDTDLIAQELERSYGLFCVKYADE